MVTLTMVTGKLTTLTITNNQTSTQQSYILKKIQSEIINLKNENLLTLKTANSLLKEKIKTPDFHLLPKMHKANNLRKLAISFVNFHTNRISEFLDYYL